ncbi:MAG TPA: DUF2306 domain-containing protein [Hyphomicrobiaceae bacterium]|nr:DUF2306 domain-containing protein [Hyphomicrobiaceae bacterium]
MLGVAAAAMLKSIIAICPILVGLVAIATAAGLVKLPIELWLLDQRVPSIFRIHMAASGLAMIAIVVTLLLRAQPRWHRPLGRLAAVAILVGATTALPSALASEATIVARLGFASQAIAWLAALTIGVAAIRQRRIAFHRRAMLAMAAIASGAIWLRLATVAAVVLDLPFDAVYAITAWAGWIVPLAAVLVVTEWLGASVVPSSPTTESGQGAARYGEA